LNASGDFKIAVKECTKAIQIDPKAVKAYFNRSQAYRKLFSFDEATEDLKAAIKLNPQDKKLRSEFESLKEEKKKHAMS